MAISNACRSASPVPSLLVSKVGAPCQKVFNSASIIASQRILVDTSHPNGTRETGKRKKRPRLVVTSSLFRLLLEMHFR